MLFRTQTLHQQAKKILKQADRFHSLSEADLIDQARELTWSARSGKPLKSLLHDVYALGIAASYRTLGYRHYPVQVVGAISLFHGQVVEMQTGEGKTLTAVLPVLLRAMVDKGVHVITTNDYLAARDAEEMGQVFAQLGLSTGCIIQNMSDQERAEQYRRDITYGVASEIGFDFLRDRLKGSGDNGFFNSSQTTQTNVQRGQYFALIDEADSILVDEARTPLIIGVDKQTNDSINSLYCWCRDMIGSLELGRDFQFDAKNRIAKLTQTGSRAVIIMPKPSHINSIETERIYQNIEKALTAKLAFKLGRDYIISEREIVIVDEGTGRKLEGRKWQDGLHQSIEAKEGVEITSATGSAAKVTIQTLFLRYKHLAGMTGTAIPVRSELKKIYKLNVSVIPTHRPCLRKEYPARFFVSQDNKADAIISEIHQLIADKRSVLVGTPSVEASQFLSNRLTKEKIEHTVLNALFHEQEADIVRQAGQIGRVTIATNMAGRGTDIPLHDVVRQNGGLHVIATEIHSSKRIDRQLIGRTARQGEPGSYQFFISLEDELFRSLTPAKHNALLRKGLAESNMELNSSWMKVFQRLQRSLEKSQSRAGRRLLNYERERTKNLQQAGLDPFLDATDT